MSFNFINNAFTWQEQFILMMIFTTLSDIHADHGAAIKLATQNYPDTILPIILDHNDQLEYLAPNSVLLKKISPDF